MRYKRHMIVVAITAAFIILVQCTKTFKEGDDTQEALEQKQASEKNKSLIAQGKQIFRFDDFADTGFWSGLLHIDQAIAGANLGGFGPGVSPKAALGIGLKVDVDALPQDVIDGIVSGAISLDSPSTTLALLKLNAVVGVNGYFTQAGTLDAIGITCASCHSTVDNSFDKGIGHRLDGWPNRDLDVGGIISLTNNALPIANLLHVDEPTLRHVLDLWGPGKFSAILFMDGKAFNPVTGMSLPI